jgi:hypothetical protein
MAPQPERLQPPFLETGGESQRLYESLRAEALGGTPRRPLEPGLSERFAQAGLWGLLSPAETPLSAPDAPGRIHFEPTTSTAEAWRTLLDACRFLIDQALQAPSEEPVRRTA